MILLTENSWHKENGQNMCDFGFTEENVIKIRSKATKTFSAGIFYKHTKRTAKV